MDLSSPLLDSVSTGGHLRPIDARRDLLAVADLVELCFRDTLDSDGYQYLRQMRDLARHSSILTFAYNLVESAAQSPVSGFVWEQDGRIVGNASLLPVTTETRRLYLIANVAVAPDMRNQGIGRALTAAAVSHARHKGREVWLQVREENQSAVHLYRSLGFRERARRTTWRANLEIPRRPVALDTQIRKRADEHWASQLEWLNRLYPPELRWHLSLDRNLFQPGLSGLLYRALAFERIEQWSVLVGGRLAGVLSWRKETSGQNIWLAAPSQVDSVALAELLSSFRWHIGRLPQASLKLECPSDFAARPLEDAGFYPFQTLIWMDSPEIEKL
jgi:ribosomal protein S18 acetylase RimI-like enzyme